MLGLFLFDRSFLNIVTITFSALIIIELLNVLTELHKRHCGMILSVGASLLVYFLTIYFFRNRINVSTFMNWDFFFKISIITAIAWIPLHAFKHTEKRVFPSDYDTIMKEKGHRRCFL